MSSVIEIKFFEWDDTDKNEWNETRSECQAAPLHNKQSCAVKEVGGKSRRSYCGADIAT